MWLAAKSSQSPAIAATPMRTPPRGATSMALPQRRRACSPRGDEHSIDSPEVGCSNTSGGGAAGLPPGSSSPSRSPRLQGASRRRWLALGLLVGLAGAASRNATASVASETAFHRGVVAYGAGQLDEARREFERVLADDPTSREAL